MEKTKNVTMINYKRITLGREKSQKQVVNQGHQSGGEGIAAKAGRI